MSSTTGGSGGSKGGGTSSSFPVLVLKSRWFMIFTSLLIMIGGGATYIFRIYSKEIKESLGYDDAAINSISFYKDVGANVAIFAGLIGEVIPPWLMLLIGASMNFGSYYMIWLAVAGKIAKPQVWQMCLYIAIGTNSQNFTNTAAVVNCVKSFPESRGIVIGLLKGLVGLSGAFLTQLYKGIYGDDLKSLILLTGWFPALASLVSMFTIRTMKIGRQPNELKVFMQFFYLTVLLAVFLMVVTLLQNYIDFPEATQGQSAILAVVLLLLPLYIVIKEEFFLSKLKKQTPTGTPQLALPEPEAGSSLDTQKKETNPELGSCFSNIFNKPERGEDFTILQAILSIDMLYIFMLAICGMGPNLTAIDNFRRIGESKRYNPQSISSIITLVSIWNYFGRIYAGFVSEILLAKWKFPRPLMVAFVLLVACIGILMIPFPLLPGSFYLSTVLIGFSHGAQVTLLFAIISELFGLKHYSTLFNCAQLASPLGTYLLNSKLTKTLYDREALKGLRREGLDESYVSQELKCTGHHCYRLSFSILAFVAFLGVLIAFSLAKRTREFYAGDVYKKFRDEKYSRGDTYKRYRGETYIQFTHDEEKASETPQPSR